MRNENSTPACLIPGIMGGVGTIRWVFFDFAGTLAFNDPPRAWQYLRVAAKRGVFVERRAVWDALKVAWAPYDNGEGLAHCDASVSSEAYEAFRAEREADILDLLGVTTDRDTAIKELRRPLTSPRRTASIRRARRRWRRSERPGFSSRSFRTSTGGCRSSSRG